MTKWKKRELEVEEPKYHPTEQEKALLGEHDARINAAPIAPRLKVIKGETRTEISTDHPHSVIGRGLLMEAMGTADQSFASALITQLVEAGSRAGEIDEADVNYMLAVIKGIKPRDHLEAMLAAQMAAIHRATLTFAGQLANAEDVPQQDSAERALNRLVRTYASQMESLKRYRTGGEQKVTVQHVSVSEGGQAIVGNVTQAKPENEAGKSSPSSPPMQTRPKRAPT